MILLDSDVMIDVLRQYLPALKWLESRPEEEIGLCGFVVMELIQGCRTQSEQRGLERELRQYQVIWPSPDACERALATFTRYRLSQGLTILDVLIGETAAAEGLPLYTFNQKHYRTIQRLETVRPYVKSGRITK
jgi:predicted nucleic acid-binding protein